MIRLILVLALLLLSACFDDRTVEATAPPPASLKVATWNLEHLAEADGTGCRPRTEADYAQLRDAAVRLDADVVALQEVESKAAAERVFTPDRYRIVMEERAGGARAGECRGLPGQTIQRQAVGYAIRNGLGFTRNDDLRDLGLGNPDLRWGVDVTVHGRTPVRLLAVHLKSGCNSGRDPHDRDCDVLFEQLPVMERWIDARAAEGAAFAVLGDFNRRLATGDAFLAGIDDGDPAGADLTLAAEGRPAACKARYREFIDHIVVGSVAGERVQPGSFEEFTYGVPEERYPSDHCPVAVRIGS